MTNCKGRSVSNKTNGQGKQGGSFVNWTINLHSVQSDKFLNLLLSMVPVVYHKNQDERHNKKVNGLWQDGLQLSGHGFGVRTDQHMDYHRFSEPTFHHGINGHNSSSCSPKYDNFSSYNYSDGMDKAETDTLLQDNISSDGDEESIVEGGRKQPKESSSIMALQILVPFLLAGFGTVSAGMVLDIVQVGLPFYCHSYSDFVSVHSDRVCYGSF